MANGYMFAVGPCYVCHDIFSFDPELVISINGVQVCLTCAELLNQQLEEDGKPPVTIYYEAYT